MEYLLQDSVDENLEWKADLDPEHPLKKVCDYIQNAFNHTNKNQPFNLGDKLEGLTQSPFGLFQSYAPMAMVAFAMRKYAGKIFDLNGKPRTAKHLVDDIVEMFKAWESGKSSGKLNFMFESREAGAITKRLISTFKLNKLPKYSDISSLTDARWAMTHEYSASVGYPLWSLKYVADCSENVQKLIDGIVKVISDTESVKNPQLMTMVSEGLKATNTDLGNLLLKSANNFEKGFKNYVKSIEIVNLQDGEFDDAMNFLKGHLEGTVGLWTEEKVKDTLKDWRLSQNSNSENTTTDNTTGTGNTIGTGNTTGNSGVSQPDVVKESPSEFWNESKRRMVVEKVMKIEPRSMHNLVYEICMKANAEVFDIILKYVD